MRRGKVDEAIDHYRAALRAGAHVETHSRLSPAIVHNSLGNALVQKGDINDALVHYRSAVQLRPDFVDARVNLSAMLRRHGDLDAAIFEYKKVLAIPPDHGESHRRLAAMLVEASRIDEATAHYRNALELTPNSLDAMNALAWILSTSADPTIRNGPEGLALAQRANRLTGGDDPVVLRILAAGYAATGRVAEASSTAQRALSLAGSNQTLVHALETEIESYHPSRDGR